MAANIKLKLQVVDRVGAMAQIAAGLAANDLNILAMEVEKSDGATFVFLDLETGAHSPPPATILAGLQNIPNIRQAETIRTLPQERREKRFQVVLDSINDGILAINEEGEITTINRVARTILDCPDEKLVGRQLQELGLADSGLLDCLEGKTYHNVKRSLTSGSKRHQFLTTGRVIRDSAGRIVGAVEVLRDMKGVRELASAVTREPQFTFNDMVGQSPALRQAIALAEKIAPTRGIVLIRGESGTGKELFASAIHIMSGCCGPFIPVNCAALPETLLESELFGYTGGAFSGAKKEGRAGLFEAARDGSIFLDEIAELPPPLQAKLLRVIQDGKLRRIGSNEEISVNARVITATNRDLEQLVRQGQFREDLYYRINLFPVFSPPLRARLEDIPLLAEHFLFQVNARLGQHPQQLSAAAQAKLKSHHWPGNIRELRNVIERASILTASDLIGSDSIRFSFEIDPASLSGAGEANLTESLADQVARLERRIIAEALLLTPSKRQAAQLLGFSHTALLKKLKKYPTLTETKNASGI